MACACFLKAAGGVALAYLGYRLLVALRNIFFVYMLPHATNLKEKAGAKWAVVTGATDGIGKAYATELAHRGFNILLVSRTQSKLDETKSEILAASKNVEVRTFAFDFTAGSSAAYKPLIETLEKLEVGILVNNVGMSYEYPEVLHKVDGGVDKLAGITVINTLPPTVLSAAVLPQMSARKSGIIVNVASSAAYNPMALWAVYSASKKYVTWLTSILRREYANSGITIQTVCPMMVATKMSKIKRTSFFVPDVNAFGRSAINTIGTADETTGYFSHQLQVEIMNFIPQCVKDYFLTNMSKGTRAAALRKKERESKQQ